MDGVGHGLARDAAHPPHVVVQLLGKRHRQAGHERLPVHVGVVVELEAAAAPDHFGVLFGGGGLAWPGEDRELVVKTHDLAALVERVGRCLPILELLRHVRHHLRHLALGVLGGADMIGGDDGSHGRGIKNLHAHGDQERAGILQRWLHQIADEAVHLPQRKLFGEGLDRVEACLHGFVSARLGEHEPQRSCLLQRVEVDDLIADFATIVIVQGGQPRSLDAMRVAEQRTPVDEVVCGTDPVRKGGRAQRGRDAFAQQQQVFAHRHVVDAARDAHAQAQLEVAHRVVVALGERTVCTLQKMGHPPAGKGAVQVGVASRTPVVLGFFALVFVFHAQVAVLRRAIEHMRRAEQHPLDAGAWRASRVQGHEDLSHTLVGAGLRYDFEHEAERFPVHEEALFRDIRRVG